MMKLKHLRTKLIIPAALTLLLSPLLLTYQPQTVEAAFPGLNGKIAFEAMDNGTSLLASIRADGSQMTVIREAPNDVEYRTPIYSADGTKIVFARRATLSSDRHDIYTIGHDGNNLTQLTDEVANDQQAAWSPDGSQIVFRSDRDGANDIFIMNADGSNQTNITNHASNDGQPSWSPDGTKILFNSNRDSGNNIYTMNPDGSNVVNLTNQTGTLNTQADWSPDGSKITFRSNRDGGEDVFVMNADGSNQTNITNTAFNDRNSKWSPDGTRITFQSDRDGQLAIYTMAADGSNPTNTSGNTLIASNPSWQPLTIPPTTLDSNRTFEVAAGGSVTIDTVVNHTDTYGSIDPASVAITIEPQQGATDINPANGEITYTATNANSALSTLKMWAFKPALAQSNQDSFTYQICSDQHPELCSSETITLTVGDHPGLPDTGASYTLVLALGALAATILAGAATVRRRFAGTRSRART